MRCVRLAEALGVPCQMSLRSADGARETAARLSAHVVKTGPRGVGAGWDVLVVDDPAPRHAAPWIAAARGAGVLSVSIHDLGLGAPGADILVDGSLGGPYREWRAGTCHLGPRFSILASGLRQRRRPPGRAPTVLVSLGGGPRATLALRLALAINRRLPAVRVELAPGLGRGASALAGSSGQAVFEIVPPSTFRRALAAADVAVLAGGVSLYESAALGTPAVAIAVVDAQRPTVRAFGREGIARDGGRLSAHSPATRVNRVARLVGELVHDPARRRVMARRGLLVVDGRGAARVARSILSAWTARVAGCTGAAPRTERLEARD